MSSPSCARHSDRGVIASPAGRRAGPSRDNTRFAQFDLAEAGPAVFDDLGRPDALIHLAWGGLPNYRSLHHFEDELPIHYGFLSRMVKAGLASLVVAGTCFEYGMQSGALDEAMDARPTNPYGFAKNALRLAAGIPQVASTLSPSAGDVSSTFTARAKPPNSLLPQLERAVARGDAAFPMSGGEQLRDYLPVSEIGRLW